MSAAAAGGPRWISRVRLHRAAGATGTLAALMARASKNDHYQAHRLIWALFGDDGERRRDFLYRAQEEHGPGAFLVVSAREPINAHGLFEIESKPYDPQLRTGDRLAFALRACPTVSRSRPGARSKKHDVVMDARYRAPHPPDGSRLPLDDETLQHAALAWLAVRAERAGFKLGPDGCRAEAYRQHRLGPRHPPGARFSSVDFAGPLTVTEPARFRQALFEGLGAARAFGCGLLLVRRRPG